jgi:ATP-dependent HslUV protease subunit HslV
MSTIVVVLRPDRVVLGADTRSVQGGQVTSAEHHPVSKIIQVGSSLLAIAGASSAKHAVSHYFSKRDYAPELGSVADIYEACLELHSALRTDYFLNQRYDGREFFESSQMEVIIANLTGAYVVSAGRSVDRVARFRAIGSGEMYAMGALHALCRDSALEPEEIVARAIAAAAEFDSGTGLPSHICTVMRPTGGDLRT